ncbi:MAG: family 43 glycosylhydrolase, partial [Oscillospiraceae bacterium]|nr:family 43 glycosylhydrolase [Oscillospiraceae bacterium]
MKIIRGFALFLAVLMVFSCVLLAGCQTNQPQMQYEIASYQGQLAEGQTKSDYNSELFYRNDKKADCPDPFVLDNTAVDGWYYLYGTESSLFCYRSRDLMDWERVGNALDNMGWDESKKISEIRRTTWKDIWAPEVVYDPDDGLYYMFFSATPEEDKNVKEGNGVMGGSCGYVMMVAVSQYPDRDFRLVNFKDPASCGEENV